MRYLRTVAGALGAGMLLVNAPMAALASPQPVAPMVRQVGQGSYQNLIAGLDNLDAEIAQVTSTPDLTPTNVRFFDAEYLASGEDAAALDQAVASHGQQIQAVPNTLSNHEVMRTALQMVNIPVENVVAVDALDAGDVAVYYQQ